MITTPQSDKIESTFELLGGIKIIQVMSMWHR